MGTKIERDAHATEMLMTMVDAMGKEPVVRALHIGSNRYYDWKRKGVPADRADEVAELYDGYREKLRRKQAPIICRYNSKVDCIEEGEACGECGWNPEVMAARIKEYRKRLKT